jgi:hypothetical protein
MIGTLLMMVFAVTVSLLLIHLDRRMSGMDPSRLQR